MVVMDQVFKIPDKKNLVLYAMEIWIRICTPAHTYKTTTTFSLICCYDYTINIYYYVNRCEKQNAWVQEPVCLYLYNQ